MRRRSRSCWSRNNLLGTGFGAAAVNNRAAPALEKHKVVVKKYLLTELLTRNDTKQPRKQTGNVYHQ